MKYRINKAKEFKPVKIEIELESQFDLDEFCFGIGKTCASFGEKLYEKLLQMGAKQK